MAREQRSVRTYRTIGTDARRGLWSFRVEAKRIRNTITTSERAVPTFLILGAQKAGTTSLFNYLVQHPNIGSPLKKEIHYFDDRFERDLRWYQSHFPTIESLGESGISGESSPYYLVHPLVPARVHATLPDARLICLLRDPVERAVSHWNHETRRGTETLPLTDALEMEKSRTGEDWRAITAGQNSATGAHRKFSYVHRGLYLEQIERWQRYFPPKQLLIIDSSQLFRDSTAVLDTVLDFLQMDDPFDDNLDTTVPNRGLGIQASDQELEMLSHIFANPNAELFAHLNREFTWR